MIQCIFYMEHSQHEANQLEIFLGAVLRVNFVQTARYREPVGIHFSRNATVEFGATTDRPVLSAGSLCPLQLSVRLSSAYF